MAAAQGSLSLLDDPIAQDLLHSTIPARLAYVWPDGTPRVVPVWFHWNGSDFVIGTPPRAPKLKALRVNPKVALTIDDNTFPHKVLMVRGTASLENVDGIVPEYELAAHRYFDEEQATAWLQQLRQMLNRMVRIKVRPEWVGILDFQSRFPSALSS
jgi:Pyridoxamine 5'-phosphate oxidase